MDWETLYCPNPQCRGYGKPWKTGLLVKNGSSRGEPQALCKACGSSVTMSYGTAYYGLNADDTIFQIATRALAEGNSLRATGRIVQVDKDTVCAWLDRVARHCRHVLLSLWHNLAVQECQLDELWSFVHTKEQNLPGAQLYCETYGDAWVWLAFAPAWRLVLAFVIGKRIQANADLLLLRVLQVSDPSLATLPLFTSDRLPEYEQALLNVYGEWYQPARQGRRGRMPQPRQKPLAGLLYAQVVKKREAGRVVAVGRQVVFGTPEAVEARLAQTGVSHTINTSFVERDNLTQRQSNRRLTRRTNGFSKDLSWFEKQLWLSLAYYHLVLPHHSLHRTLPIAEPTRGTGSLRVWEPITPAMAAGLTDHVWSTEELLGYRVPAEFLEKLPRLERLFPDWPPFHQGS